MKRFHHFYTLHHPSFRIKKPQSTIVQYSYFNKQLEKRQPKNGIAEIYLLKPWRNDWRCFYVTNSSLVWVMELASYKCRPRLYNRSTVGLILLWALPSQELYSTRFPFSHILWIQQKLIGPRSFPIIRWNFIPFRMGQFLVFSS